MWDVFVACCFTDWVWLLSTVTWRTNWGLIFLIPVHLREAGWGWGGSSVMSSGSFHTAVSTVGSLTPGPTQQICVQCWEQYRKKEKEGQKETCYGSQPLPEELSLQFLPSNFWFYLLGQSCITWLPLCGKGDGNCSSISGRPRSPYRVRFLSGRKK